MVTLLHESFMQHALWASLLVSIACGVMGSLIVVNRLSFMSGGIAHGAYGGVGLALYFGWPVWLVTSGFCAGLAMILGLLSEERHERTDTLIGVIWAAGMSLGVVMINLTPGYAQNLMSYLFGSLLTVTRQDIALMGIGDLLMLALVAYNFRDLMSMSFDRDFARSRGVPVRALQLVLLVLIAETIVMLIQVVGLVLVIALLTLPPALAERHTRSLRGMMLAAAGWSLLSSVGGLLLAYAYDLSSGASIVAVACACYTLLAALQKVLNYMRQSNAVGA